DLLRVLGVRADAGAQGLRRRHPRRAGVLPRGLPRRADAGRAGEHGRRPPRLRLPRRRRLHRPGPRPGPAPSGPGFPWERGAGLMPRLRTLLPYALLVVALVLFPLVASTNLVNIGVYVLIFTIAAVGLSLLMGLAGQVSLGQAAFFAVGAYTQAILVTKHDWPMLAAVPVAVLAAMVLARLVGIPLLRLRGHFLALATLGLGIIVTVVVRELDYTGGTSGIYGISKPEFGGRVYNTPAA